MKRFLLNLMYDGSELHGWQIQPDTRTVQAIIENKLSQMNRCPITVYGSGRTDSNVHATDQFAHFDSKIDISAQLYKKALNSMLPRDVRVKKVWEVNSNFHARYCAFNRVYHYLIAIKKNPFYRNYSAFFHFTNDPISFFNETSKNFIGEHDFSTFSKFNPTIKSQYCKIQKIHFIPYRNFLIVSISANRFLHNMVRRIVGTLVVLYQRKLPPETIKQLLEQKNPKQTLVYTAPAEGLYLVKVRYPIQFTQKYNPSDSIKINLHSLS